MNRLSVKWLIVTLASAAIQAQGQVQTQTGGPSSPTPSPLGAVQILEPQASGSNTQQVLIQSAPAQQTQIKQPTTYVEASPISESRADQMRRMRQDVEVQTEQKIVEKLEQSRLEDERKRMDRLFGGGGLGQESAPVQPAPQPAPQIQPQPQLIPVVVQAPPEEKTEKVEQINDDVKAMKEEILGAIRESKTQIEPIKEEAKTSQTYFAGTVGAASYPGVSNLQGRGVFGIAIGSKLENNVSLEGQFLYSNFYLDEAFFSIPNYRESLYRKLDQYNFGLNAKIGFLSGTVQPYVGGGLAYVYRQYKDLAVVYSNDAGASIYPAQSSSSISSHALDASVIGGVSFQVAKNLSLGVEYRYAFNIINWADSAFNNVVQQFRRTDGRSLVEDTSYQTFGVNATYQF